MPIEIVKLTISNLPFLERKKMKFRRIEFKKLGIGEKFYHRFLGQMIACKKESENCAVEIVKKAGIFFNDFKLDTSINEKGRMQERMCFVGQVRELV